MTYAVKFHGPRHKILSDYNANIPFSFVYFCMHDETPYFSNIPFLKKTNVSIHNEYKTVISQIQIIGVKYIRNNIKTVVKQFSEL